MSEKVKASNLREKVQAAVDATNANNKRGARIKIRSVLLVFLP